MTHHVSCFQPPWPLFYKNWLWWFLRLKRQNKVSIPRNLKFISQISNFMTIQINKFCLQVWRQKCCRSLSWSCLKIELHNRLPDWWENGENCQQWFETTFKTLFEGNGLGLNKLHIQYRLLWNTGKHSFGTFSKYLTTSLNNF